MDKKYVIVSHLDDTCLMYLSRGDVIEYEFNLVPHFAYKYNTQTEAQKDLEKAIQISKAKNPIFSIMEIFV